MGEETTETRIALIGVMVEDLAQTDRIHDILHERARYFIGRMGVPYREKSVAIISVILDAPVSVTSALAGKLGQLPGVSVKTMYTKAVQ